jgi:enoyl-CoA hydratase/carnithine racemase
VAPLTIERHGPAVLIGLNRPEKRNAINREVVDQFHVVLAEQARTPSVLVIHSTTSGIFAAGVDIAELVERRADDAFGAINAGLFERVEAHPWPTIAVIDGPALGGGCELALACDLRVATRNARFAQPEPSLGIIAGAGGNWRLSQLVGIALARRMLYLGAVVDADEALAAQLVDELCEPDEVLSRALELADAIAMRSWRALRLTKLALRQHRPATTDFDVVAQALLFEDDEKRERMQAFLTRRTRSSSAEGPAGARG